MAASQGLAEQGRHSSYQAGETSTALSPITDFPCRKLIHGERQWHHRWVADGDHDPGCQLLQSGQFWATEQERWRVWWVLSHNSDLAFLDFPSLTKLSKKKERKETRTQRLRREKTRGFRTTKINPQDYNIQFDLEDYLHKDKIKEIMNLESLEESLEEVLTISGSEMDEMFKCRGVSSKSPSALIRLLKNILILQVKMFLRACLSAWRLVRVSGRPRTTFILGESTMLSSPSPTWNTSPPWLRTTWRGWWRLARRCLTAIWSKPILTVFWTWITLLRSTALLSLCRLNLLLGCVMCTFTILLVDIIKK